MYVHKLSELPAFGSDPTANRGGRIRVAASVEWAGHGEQSAAIVSLEAAAPAPDALPAATNGAITISGAVEMFFGDLRLAPRSKKTYRHGVTKFLKHLE